MRSPLSAALALSVAAIFSSNPATADEFDLKLVATGGSQVTQGYSPQRLMLSATKPEDLKKAPAELTSPLYGSISNGTGADKRSFLVIIDEPDGKPARLFVDANSNGDLTDDPAAEWKGTMVPGPNGAQFMQYMGGANLEASFGGKKTPVHYGVYRFDKNDPRRSALKDIALYFTDYALQGEVKLGTKSYRVVIADRVGSGDFNSAQLMIDVNGNGRFDARGEVYPGGKPINIGGTTYDFTLSGSGKIAITKSAKTVAEVLPPPDLSPGKKAITFNCKTTDGKEISFPSSYKGKIVMLDFWATWCGPCIGELPGLVAAYKKFNSRGFEVLGISLDQKDWAEKLATFTKERGMPWAQVYDGKYWQAEIAQLYVVNSIPAAFLVDGDTGQIIAAGNSLRGGELDKTIEKALAKRSASIK